jgi:octaprenyl-diphosphate synthase
MENMASTTNTIAEGEVLQLVRAGDASASEQQYLDVITRKTAILFASACYGAGALAGADEDTRHALHEFGLNTGIAFQIYDDMLDYTGDPAEMGKNVGDDLGEGKLTLPLIHLLQTGSSTQKALVEQAITQKDSSQIDAVVEAVQNSGSLDYAGAMAQGYKAQAMANLLDLPANPFRDAMEAIAQLSVNRNK